MNVISVDGKVFRGPRPNTDADFQQLRDLGIGTILNLERGWFEFFHNELNREVQRAIVYGMNPVHLQLGDLCPPTRQDLGAAVELLVNPKHGKVYVHCLHGVDRTGLVCAAYRVRACGFSPQRAIAEMLQLGFHRWFYFWWLPGFIAYLGG